MKRNNYLRRYLGFVVGVFFMALGISLITKTDLGTTPITSLPYVVSLGAGMSLGIFSGLLNVTLVIVQIILLRRKFPRIQLLQLPASLLFGFCIGFSMNMAPAPDPDSYTQKLLWLAMGNVVLAFGIFVEVASNVVMMAGEGVVVAIAIVTRRDFGTIKVLFDVLLVALGAALSFILFQELRGIREGTAISALVVGFIVKFFFAMRKKLAKQAEAQ